MGDEKLPRLTEALLRNLATESSFERGQNYYRDGAILEPIQQEMELRARCEGSDYEPYQVSATLTESGTRINSLQNSSTGQTPLNLTAASRELWRDRIE